MMAAQSPKPEKPTGAQSAEVDGGTTGVAAADEGDTERAETAQKPTDAKSAFSAALERKKTAGQARSAHLDGHGGVGGSTASHKATRLFRRKSG